MRNKDIIPKNAKGQPHGYWDVYWWNGELRYKCVFHNGKRIGYEIDYNYYSNKLTKIYNL